VNTYAGRRHGAELRVEHLADRVAALLGAQVPGEADQVAPVALVVEQRGGGRAVARGQRGLETGQPGGGAGGRGDRGGQGLAHRHVSFVVDADAAGLCAAVPPPPDSASRVPRLLTP
jgi:hypothetical protein